MDNLPAKACKEVDNNKNGRLTLKMIGEAQLEVELQRIVAIIYPLFVKKQAVQPHLKPGLLNTASFDFMCSSKWFLEKHCRRPQFEPVSSFLNTTIEMLQAAKRKNSQGLSFEGCYSC